MRPTDEIYKRFALDLLQEEREYTSALPLT